MAYSAHLDSILNKCQYHPNTRSYLIQETNYVMSLYPCLSVQATDLVVYNQSRVFLCLNGTIPIPYKGSVYNIPIRIIYPDTYPAIPPIVRVIPTANMVVRPSEYVEEDGTVKLSILYSWNYTYTTMQIIDQLIAAFSNRMPVYQRPSSASSQSVHSVKPVQSLPQMPLYVPDPNILNLLKTNYEKVYKDLKDEIAKLKAQGQALDLENREVSQFIQRANEEQVKISSTYQALESALKTTEAWIEVNASKDLTQFSEDQLYVPLNPSCRQIIGLLSAERALEDTIEKIQRAFDKNQITAVSMVRTLKKLNSQLFMTSKLREKVEQARG